MIARSVWPVLRSVQALEACLETLKRTIPSQPLPYDVSAELTQEILRLRRSIARRLGMSLRLGLDETVMIVKLVCSRCGCRPAKTGYASCNRCLGYSIQVYDQRIGGAQNLKKGQRRLKVLAKAA